MEATIPKPCPACGHLGLLLRVGLLVAPVGSFSLAGVQDKVAAREVATVSCPGCGESRQGRLVDVQIGPGGVITGGRWEEVRP